MVADHTHSDYGHLSSLLSDGMVIHGTTLSFQVYDLADNDAYRRCRSRLVCYRRTLAPSVLTQLDHD